MLHGINTNVEIAGETYHVQTEDYGVDNPVVVTLVYRGGAIVSSRRTNYADLLDKQEAGSLVKRLVEDQHGQMLSDLKSDSMTRKNE